MPHSPSRYAGAALLILCASHVVCPVAASTVFVDDTAAASGDGLSWDSAFRDLQDALDAARLDGAIDRDPATHLTVLTGDLLGDDGRPDAILSIPNSGDNTQHLVRASDLSPATTPPSNFVSPSALQRSDYTPAQDQRAD